MTSICHVHTLGLVPYQEAWDLQNQLAAEVHSGSRPPSLLLLEHPHTYTFGRSGNERNLLWDGFKLLEKEVEVHWVDRGGDVTYHGPGQLVGYPLLPLGKPSLRDDPESGHIPQADYVGYLRQLERMLLSTLANFGVLGKQQPGMTGVWILPDEAAEQVGSSQTTKSRPRKIASIGVKVDAHGISRHGFSLNVNPDMSYWEGIIACGLDGFAETSLVEALSSPPAMESVIDNLIASFGEEFNYRMQRKPL